MRPKRTLAATLATAALALGAPAAPQARTYNCSGTNVYDGQSWNHVLCGMPDFDQRRATDETVGGLPGDGEMYCVPATAVNAMAYLSSHGFPELGPGPADLETGAANYANVTGAIAEMGAMMGTDAVNGTGAAGPGIQQWLERDVPGQFVASEYWSTADLSVDFKAMSEAAIGGGVVLTGLGLYLPPDGDPSGPLLRVGGHFSSLVSTQRIVNSVGTFSFIALHDPYEDEGDLFRQSPFKFEAYSLSPLAATYGWKDGAGTIHTYQSELMVLENPGAGDHGWSLDNYVVIRPTLLGAITGAVVGVADASGGRPKVYESYTGTNVLDLALHPMLQRAVYVAEGSDAVWQIDLLTGRTAALADVAGPKRLALGGRDQCLYVLAAGGVVGLDRDGRRVKAARLPAGAALDAIAFDESRGRLVGYAARSGRLVFFDAGLRPVGTARVPAMRDPASSELSVSPADGTVWLHEAGSPLASRVRVARSGRAAVASVRLGATRSPRGLVADARGHLLVSDGGYVVELDGNGRAVDRPAFRGARGGDVLRTLRPFSNFDPRTMNGPAFHNIRPRPVR